MGYCETIPHCRREGCEHPACAHAANDPLHPCDFDPSCDCNEFMFPEGTTEADFEGGGGSSGGGGATGGW